MTAGLQAAAGEVVVMMDADLQHPPALILTMIEQWRNGADIVYAVRANRKDEGLLKRLGARLFYTLLNRSSRFDVPADAGDFRLLDRAAVRRAARAAGAQPLHERPLRLDRFRRGRVALRSQAARPRPQRTSASAACST